MQEATPLILDTIILLDQNFIKVLLESKSDRCEESLITLIENGQINLVTLSMILFQRRVKVEIKVTWQYQDHQEGLNKISL